MRKYISIMMFAALAAFVFSACDTETDEKPGGTKIVKMAGFWDVTVQSIKEDGSVLSQDPYGLGTTSLKTYNTVDDADNRMWLNLDGKDEFYDMQLIVPIDYAAKTFSCEATKYVYNSDKAGNVTITEGKVLLGQGRNLHGLPTDSIVFTAKFSDDEKNLTYRITGIKHSGFTE